MYTLLAAATYNEINTTADWLEGNGNKHTEVLFTGIGGAATSWALTKKILNRRPGLIIQAGIGGSFTEELPPGSISFVHEEVFGDLGAIEEEGWVDIFDLGLAGSNAHPFSNRLLVNPATAPWVKYGLPFHRGATVNCISSSRQQIERIKDKYRPAIESMEGASLHYVCLLENIPFIQIRAISNYAGERNKKNWKMKEAIQLLNEKIKIILTDL